MCTSPVLIGLGIVPVPGQEESVVDLPMARHFIDLLALLDEKTAGSLSAEEQQAIDQSLHVRQNILLIISGRKGTHPTVKNLYRVGTTFNLPV